MLVTREYLDARLDLLEERLTRKLLAYLIAAIPVNIGGLVLILRMMNIG